MSLQEEVEEKRLNLKNLFLHRSGSAPRRPEGTIACIPNAMIMVKSDLFDLKNWMDSSIAKVDCIEAQLDEAICEEEQKQSSSGYTIRSDNKLRLEIRLSSPILKIKRKNSG